MLQNVTKSSIGTGCLGLLFRRSFFALAAVAVLGCGAKNPLVLISNAATYANSLEDPGLKHLLEKRIRESQFILVGEQHGIQEPSRVAELIFNSSRSSGSAYLAIETSPLVAGYIERFAREDSLDSTLKSAKGLSERFPGAVPFYENEGDYRLFRQVLASGPDSNPTIWGLDQTFVLEWTLALSSLREVCDQHEDRTLDEAVALAVRAYSTVLRTGDLKEFMFHHYTDSLHAKLQGTCQGEEASAILTSLARSRSVDEANLIRGEALEAVALRSQLMSDNFTDYYESAALLGDLPRVVLKLGYDHIGRGENASGILDIGHHVQELASRNSTESLHVLVRGLWGTESHRGLFSPSRCPERFDELQDLPREMREFVETERGSSRFIVVDFSSLRAHSGLWSNEFSAMLQRFDVAIFVGQAEGILEFGYSDCPASETS